MKGIVTILASTAFAGLLFTETASSYEPPEEEHMQILTLLEKLQTEHGPNVTLNAGCRPCGDTICCIALVSKDCPEDK